MSLSSEGLFAMLRRMKAAGHEFFYDGDSTAIRLIEVTTAIEETLAAAFRDLMARYRDNAMQVGMLLVWEGYVSPTYDEHRQRFFLVLTLEGWCPKTLADFDSEILGHA